MRLQLILRGGIAVGILLGVCAGGAHAAVLPEDRADIMYHAYEGGGTEVEGPAVLVRKEFLDSISVFASAYTDTVSSASIDIVTTASPYQETRNEYGVGVDYLHRDTTLSLSYSNSDERDYTSSTLNLGVSHEINDGLTTLSMGYALGSDDVGKTGTGFSEGVDRHHYRLGLSQVLTRSLLVNLTYEGILEEGYLNSPYRAARLQGVLVPEVYPRTRDSYAVAVRAVKGLSADGSRLDSSLTVGYRYFWDTWDVQAHTIDLSYAWHWKERWIMEPRYRYYTQTAASFFSDNFASPMTYMARDKELSTFNSHTFGAKAAYELPQTYFGMNRITLNGAADLVWYRYDDFTDMRSGEPYNFHAVVLQFFLSAWY